MPLPRITVSGILTVWMTICKEEKKEKVKERDRGDRGDREDRVAECY